MRLHQLLHTPTSVDTYGYISCYTRLRQVQFVHLLTETDRLYEADLYTTNEYSWCALSVSPTMRVALSPVELALFL